MPDPEINDSSEYLIGGYGLRVVVKTSPGDLKIIPIDGDEPGDLSEAVIGSNKVVEFDALTRTQMVVFTLDDSSNQLYATRHRPISKELCTPIIGRNNKAAVVWL